MGVLELVYGSLQGLLDTLISILRGGFLWFCGILHQQPACGSFRFLVFGGFLYS